MDNRWRMGAAFAAGLLAGALVLAGAYRWWSTRDAMPTPGAAGPAASATSSGSSEDAGKVAVAAPRACTFEPLVAPRSDGDGRFGLHAAVANQRGTDATPFLAV